MKFLFDVFPVVLFFVAFKLFDIYVATAVAIVASFLQIGWLWLRGRKIENMLWVSLGLMPSNTKGAKRDDVNYLVGYSGPMSQSPSDAGADAMSAGDLETGRLYGKRVAEAAQRWTR